MAKNKSVEVETNYFRDGINKHLSKIPEIEAVYMVENDVVHVYSVVVEFESKIYNKLLKQENLIENEFPHSVFEFHLRAHQGRQPSQAVPFGAKQVFVK